MGFGVWGGGWSGYRRLGVWDGGFRRILGFGWKWNLEQDCPWEGKIAAKSRQDCFLTEFKTSSGKLSEPGLRGLRDGQDFGVGFLNCDCGDVE